jgi:hypothetical protein
MPKPRRDAPISTFVDHVLYTQYALEARKETAGKEAILLPLLADLESTTAALLGLYRAILRTRAVVAWQDVVVDAMIYRLRDAAKLDESSRPECKILQLLFKNRRPSDVVRPTGAGFGRELDEVEVILAAFQLLPADAKNVQGLLAEITDATAAGRAAFTAFKKAIDAEALERRKLAGLKDRALQALDRIEGQLKDQYPDQRSVVASFFLPADVSRATPEEPNEPEAPTPA